MRILTIILMASLVVTATLSFISGNYNDVKLDLIFLTLLIINENIKNNKTIK